MFVVKLTRSSSADARSLAALIGSVSEKFEQSTGTGRTATIRPTQPKAARWNEPGVIDAGRLCGGVADERFHSAWRRLGGQFDRQTIRLAVGGREASVDPGRPVRARQWCAGYRENAAVYTAVAGQLALRVCFDCVGHEFGRFAETYKIAYSTVALVPPMSTMNVFSFFVNRVINV